MKKVYFSISVVSVISLLVLFGCSKEGTQPNEKQDKVYQPTEKDLQIEGKILAFKEKIEFAKENPGLKNGEDDLTIDEAVWNIEALANYTYADASSGFDNFEIETAEIEIPLTNGKVSLADAGAAYGLAIDSVTAHYNQVPVEDKHLVLADVSLKETNGQTATFNVTSGVGKGIGGGWFSDFGSTDYWLYGFLNGKCDEYLGQGIGSDAAEEIEKKVNHRISLPVGHKYFIDIKSVFCSSEGDQIIYENTTACECCSLVNPDDPDPFNNINDYLLFFNFGYPGYPNFHECLPPDEMNFYLNGLENVIYNFAYECFPTELENKLFVSCNMQANLIYGPAEYTIFHEVDIRYGTSIGSGDPPPDGL